MPSQLVWLYQDKIKRTMKPYLGKVYKIKRTVKLYWQEYKIKRTMNSETLLGKSVQN